MKRYIKLECRLMINPHVLQDFKRQELKEVRIGQELDHKDEIRIVQTIAQSIVKILIHLKIRDYQHKDLIVKMMSLV